MTDRKTCERCDTRINHAHGGLCSACIADDVDYDDNGDCWNCGGDGFVSSCFEEYACIYPDEGCDQCTRRCDVCNPPKLTDAEKAERESLRQVLADALRREQ